MNNLDGAAVAKLVNAIEPILVSRPAEIQGAALVNLLAIWLAGHAIPNDETGTHQLRDKLLAMHCSAVRTLALIIAPTLHQPTDDER